MGKTQTSRDARIVKFLEFMSLITDIVNSLLLFAETARDTIAGDIHHDQTLLTLGLDRCGSKGLLLVAK